MKHLFAGLLTLLATLVYTPVLLAQEGHPVKGSWIGVWEGNEVHGRSLLVIMDWDGEQIAGIINPGTDNIDISEASLDPDGWVVTINTDHEEDGEHYRYVLEGTITNIEQANRSISGTWSNGSDSGAFEITRQ